uniref:SAM domain-containing protein n=1 Tax=Strigamia maritima TaxID=126957 RepID=T1IW87_STRMM
MNVLQWQIDDVAHWLADNGFSEYTDLFCEVHKIDGKGLITLTEADLRQSPLNITTLGDIKRLMISIRQLQVAHKSDLEMLGLNLDNFNSPHLHHMQQTLTVPCREWPRRNKHLRRESEESQTSDRMASDQEDEGVTNRRLEPEVWKTIISIVYFFAVTWITAIVMVIVHNRVPDMDKYPPLPDIFLDSVPRIPWAFNMCEIAGCTLGTIWFGILAFHKHRFILLRRMFSLLGSVFLLRCVTMLITSLSVPGRHLECKARPEGDFWGTLDQAFSIWKGAGMSIQGVRTCGDYIYASQHVLSPHFYLGSQHVRNFFILAAHEHYSIDVFMAFYISTRLFLYYHTLANNRDLMQRDSKRTRIWFPLFSFFEGRVGAIVPNEYEWPIPTSKIKSLLRKLSNLTKEGSLRKERIE